MITLKIPKNELPVFLRFLKKLGKGSSKTMYLSKHQVEQYLIFKKHIRPKLSKAISHSQLGVIKTFRRANPTPAVKIERKALVAKGKIRQVSIAKKNRPSQVLVILESDDFTSIHQSPKAQISGDKTITNLAKGEDYDDDDTNSTGAGRK